MGRSYTKATQINSLSVREKLYFHLKETKVEDYFRLFPHIGYNVQILYIFRNKQYTFSLF